MVISSQDDTNLETKPSTPQYPAKPPEIDTDSLVLTEEWPPLDPASPINFTFKGSWPHDEELPNVEEADVWDGWLYKGRLWVKRPEGRWDELPEFATHPFQTFTPAHPYDDLLNTLAKAFGEEGLFNIQGRTETLPPPALYRENDAFIVHDGIWVRVFNGQAMWQQVYAPELVKEQIRLYDERQKKLAQDEPEEVRREDKGALARELMEHKAEVKRLRRIRIKHLCYLWLVVLISFTAIGITAYGYVKRDLVIGRYSDSRDCSLKVGNVTITGKRTYSYPAYSLWGQRWVQESKVQEVTTINLPGSKLDILMDAEPKWIGYRFSDGERGTQILKPALKYAFVMDKGMAMATYGGFCQPIDKQAVPDDPKNQERPIIN